MSIQAKIFHLDPTRWKNFNSIPVVPSCPLLGDGTATYIYIECWGAPECNYLISYGESGDACLHYGAQKFLYSSVGSTPLVRPARTINQNASTATLIRRGSSSVLSESPRVSRCGG